jgi:hypothetical protein
VTDSAKAEQDSKSFEGLWLLTRPSGVIACVKALKGQLLIPYSFGEEGKLTGHYYDCRIVGTNLVCRFEQFDSARSGMLFLKVGSDETLTGGRWMNDQIPDEIRRDISRLSMSLPGMEATVWVRIPKKETPTWAQKYFSEDWPNKAPNL